MRATLWVCFGTMAIPAACTFPDVDYADGGAGAAGGGASSSSSSSSASTSSGACPVPTSCATAATGCADDAQIEHQACVEPCKNHPPCVKACDKARQTGLGMCAAACDSCAGPTCKPNNCKSLVGL